MAEIKELIDFMKHCDRVELDLLSQVSQTPIQYLLHVAKGRRTASADLALNIEYATTVLARASSGRLTPVSRHLLRDTFRRLEELQRIGLVA